jgi:transcriptional regulator with XRE-family HTH domain
LNLVIQPIPPYDLAAFGHAVARTRRARGLTLESLAQRSGISRRMIQEIEQGRSGCSLKSLHGLAHGLLVPIGRLAEYACGHDIPDESLNQCKQCGRTASDQGDAGA